MNRQQNLCIERTHKSVTQAEQTQLFSFVFFLLLWLLYTELIIYLVILTYPAFTPLEIHFIHLDNKEIYCIFKTCSIIAVLFSTKCMYFIILSFSVQIILMSFINHALKLNTHPSYLKVNIHHFTLQCQKPFHNNNLYQRLHDVDPFLKNWSCSAD